MNLYYHFFTLPKLLAAAVLQAYIVPSVESTCFIKIVLISLAIN